MITRNDIWNNENLTKREKTVLSYNTPAPLRQAQINFWAGEKNGDAGAEAAYEASVVSWENAGRPTNEVHAQF